MRSSGCSGEPAASAQPADSAGLIGPAGALGVTRLLYDGAWLEAQRRLERRLAEAGLEPRFDRAGSLYGRLAGTEAGSGVVLTGSHIDTVRRGGPYDGAYGVAAGIAALAALRRFCGPPQRTLEVVSLCEEEGSRFPLSYWGSGTMIGRYGLEGAARYRDAGGTTLEEAMLSAGFGRPEQPHPRRGDLAAFVELHVEQGIVLERGGEGIGVVQAIVGQRRYTFTVAGEANHAGTTPMRLRRDALAGAAEMALAAERAAVRRGEPMVATVGRIAAEPGTPNVVPGRVVFTLDVRHDDAQALEAFCRELLEELDGIAARRGLELQGELWMDAPPAPMDAGLAERLERAAARRGLAVRRMASGAGHDAQLLSELCPAAMLFVPSRAGISHSPLEFTEEAQLAAGLAVLIDALYELAYEERVP
ncbi:Zn-dependent hydrolase [Paenibacillus albicereus]|uniref:Zn-dependent hydrolase n=2 Tax=Paenibacillus albicereus TaxID=2726185 RepID=A0A6H2H483_9BACL|nr:Zn-dependent hydrolase [Paenibacillus albicereus]